MKDVPPNELAIQIKVNTFNACLQIVPCLISSSYSYRRNFFGEPQQVASNYPLSIFTPQSFRIRYSAEFVTSQLPSRFAILSPFYWRPFYCAGQSPIIGIKLFQEDIVLIRVWHSSFPGSQICLSIRQWSSFQCQCCGACNFLFPKNSCWLECLASGPCESISLLVDKI